MLLSKIRLIWLDAKVLVYLRFAMGEESSNFLNTSMLYEHFGVLELGSMVRVISH
jgi:hypothetical protein